MGTGEYFDDDEILILGGEQADQSTRLLKSEIDWQEVRNYAATAVEAAMKDWDGDCSIPICEELDQHLTNVGIIAALGNLNNQLHALLERTLAANK